MASQSPDVEILVHVAAPSRTVDDVAYRRIARAYCSFQPRKQSRISVCPDLDGRCDDLEATGIGARQGKGAAPFTQSPDRLPPPPPSSSTQKFTTPELVPAFGPDSQDLSFQSALDNRSSPRLRLNTRDPKSPHQVISSPPRPSPAQLRGIERTALSQISDSYPLPETSSVNITPTRVLQRYLKRHSPRKVAQASPTLSTSFAADEFGHVDVDIPSSVPVPDEDLSHRRLREGKTAGSVIPVTPLVPTSLVRKRRELAEEGAAAAAAFDMTHVSSSGVSRVSAASPSRAESEPPPSKRSKTHHQDTDPLGLLRSSSNTGPARPSTAPAPALTSASEQPNDAATSLEIRPPSPPVGIADIHPQSFISAKLAKLARDLSSRYRPDAKRALNPLERGYWVLDCSAWSPETRLDTWVFLTNYLRSGLAGWGVWCRRGENHDWIRLYCWGHVVKHTYLLLYLASGRQIKTMGARWIGADGEVVLGVSPCEK